MKRLFFVSVVLFFINCFLFAFAQNPAPLKYRLPLQTQMALLWQQQEPTSFSFTNAQILPATPSAMSWWKQAPSLKLNLPSYNSTILTTTPTVTSAIPLMVNESMVRFYKMNPYNQKENKAWNSVFGSLDPRLRR